MHSTLASMTDGSYGPRETRQTYSNETDRRSWIGPDGPAEASNRVVKSRSAEGLRSAIRGKEKAES